MIRLSKYHLTVIPYDAYTKVYKISIGDIKVLRTRKERNKRDKETECVRERCRYFQIIVGATIQALISNGKALLCPFFKRI